MKCLKCNSEIANDSTFCPLCGSRTEQEDKQLKMPSTYNEKLGALIILLGVVACIMFFISAHSIGNSASEMIDIRSQAGTSVAEAYYQNVGKALTGFAMFSRGIGISILAFTVPSGMKQLKM